MTYMVAMLMVAGDITEVFGSPYIVPVFGTIMVLGIVVANVWSNVRAREMRSQERLAAIAKGLPLPPEVEEQAIQHVHGTAAGTSLERQRNTSRRAGLVLLFTGVGLVAFFIVLAVVLQVRPVLSGAAAGSDTRGDWRWIPGGCEGSDAGLGREDRGGRARDWDVGKHVLGAAPEFARLKGL